MIEYDTLEEMEDDEREWYFFQQWKKQNAEPFTTIEQYRRRNEISK